jgi:hypothetical protein
MSGLIEACFQSLSLREAALCAATKQSSWIAAARFAHLAMTVILKTRRSPARSAGGGRL